MLNQRDGRASFLEKELEGQTDLNELYCKVVSATTRDKPSQVWSKQHQRFLWIEKIDLAFLFEDYYGTKVIQ
jgi:hypothetical protein